MPAFVNQAAAAAAAVSLPAGWSAGDLALVLAHRDGNNTPPSLPAGWTDIISGGANGNSERAGYRVLQAGDTDIGTWTNATSVLVMIYSDHGGVGTSNQAGASSATLTIPALASMTSGSWVVGMAGHINATDVDDLVVTGMTNRTGANGTTDIGGADTNGGVASWSAQTDGVNSSAGWRAVSIEVLVSAWVEGAAALTGDGTMTAAGTRGRKGLAALTGDGTLTAAGLRSLLGAAALTGDGTLTAVGAVTTPRLSIEAAFGYAPWDTPVWTDISDYVAGFSWEYGRQNELNQMETGRGRLSVADDASAWEADNPDSPFYPDVRLGLPIRVYITQDTDVYPLFYMFVAEKPRVVRVANAWSQWDLTLTDGMELLARAGLNGQTYASEASHTRIGNILDSAGVPAGFRDIGTGIITLAAATFAADDATKALTHASAVADTEDGLFYWTADGKFRFVGRHELVQDAAWATPQATFTDQVPGVPIAADEHVYETLVPADDTANLRNRWSGTRTGGPTQTAEDTASQADYGQRDQQVTSLATTDGAVLAQMQSKLGKFALPMRRVDQLGVRPLIDTSDTDAVAASLARVVGERITVNETPPGFTVGRSEIYAIQKISGNLAGVHASLVITFQLWPATSLAGGYWTAEDAVLGLAGVTTRAAY